MIEGLGDFKILGFDRIWRSLYMVESVYLIFDPLILLDPIVHIEFGSNRKAYDQKLINWVFSRAKPKPCQIFKNGMLFFKSNLQPFTATLLTDPHLVPVAISRYQLPRLVAVLDETADRPKI